MENVTTLFSATDNSYIHPEQGAFSHHGSRLISVDQMWRMTVALQGPYLTYLMQMVGDKNFALFVTELPGSSVSSLIFHLR